MGSYSTIASTACSKRARVLRCKPTISRRPGSNGVPLPRPLFLWLLRVAWITLPVTAGPAASASLAPWSDGPRVAGAVLLWGAWALGLLATRGADVAIAVAEALAARHLPGVLASGVVAFAMQDVIDGARLAYFDDWSTFSRTAGDIRRILAGWLAAILIPAADAEKKRH